MNTHKISLALIAVLVCLNIFMFITIANLSRETEYISDSLVREAVENLNSDGIDVNEDIIDKNIYGSDIFVMKKSLPTTEELNSGAQDFYIEKICSAILGTKNIKIQYFDVPSGISVMVSDANDNLCGSLMLFDTGEISYTANGSENDAASDEYAAGNVSTKKKNSYVSGFFNEVYGMNGEISHVIQQYLTDEKYELVNVVTTIDGIPFHGMECEFRISKKTKKAESVKGRLLLSKPVRSYKSRLIDGVNAIYSLKSPYSADSGISGIISERFVYVTSEKDGVDEYIVPAWEIIYSSKDGSDSSRIIDAVYGNKLQ